MSSLKHNKNPHSFMFYTYHAVYEAACDKPFVSTNSYCTLENNPQFYS